MRKKAGAAALLLAVGFGSGFSLLKSTHHSQLPHGGDVTLGGRGGGGAHTGAGGQDGEGAQRGGMAEGQGGSEGRGAGSEGDGASGGAPEQQAAGTGGGPKQRAAGTGNAPPREAKAAAPPRAEDLLTGNTLRSTQDGRTTMRYLSTQGWQAVKRTPDEVIVTHWVSRAGQLCEITPTKALACDGVTIEPARQPDPEIGATLGTLVTDAGVRWTITRGNAGNFPTAIPLIDGEEAKANIGQAPKPTLTGHRAAADLLGHTWLTSNAEGHVIGFRYEPDGRWIRAEPLTPGVRSGRDGVRVTIGRWLSSEDTFCLDAPGYDLNRSCYRVEQWGPDIARLVADHADASVRLVGAVQGR